jgi:hypothetical protein
MAHGGSGTDARTELPARTSIMDVIKAVIGRERSCFCDELDRSRRKARCAFADNPAQEFTRTDGEAFNFGVQGFQCGQLEVDVDIAAGIFVTGHKEQV